MATPPQSSSSPPNESNTNSYLEETSDIDLPLTHSDESQIFFEKTEKGFWSRHWWKFLVILIIALAGTGIAVYFLWIKHHNVNSSKSKSNNPVDSKNSNTIFDDSKAPNNYTSPLNRTFPYGKQAIRGVNIGGWLVLEPFITPSYFQNAIVDEWTLCATLGPEKAMKTLDHHYSTFITEADFAEMVKYGLNHVRIPLGFWAVEILSDEPYVPKLSWTYLLKGIEWARKYGLRVLVELHSAPGSQNGWNHSGKQGNINWIQGTNGRANADRTLRIIAALISFFNQPKYQHVIPMFGVLNEPRIGYQGLGYNDVKQFYLDSYKLIRNITGNDKEFTPWLVFHDGFAGLDAWSGSMKGSNRVALDIHTYIIFDPNLFTLPQSNLLVFPCAVWGESLTKSTTNFGLSITGEWTVSTDDCAKYLNGVGGSAGYEGRCENCTCTGAGDYKNYSSEKKEFMLQFAQAQIDAFEHGGGWFYWTWKTENHVNPTWDYQLGVQEGWIPKDLQNRPPTWTLDEGINLYFNSREKLMRFKGNSFTSDQDFAGIQDERYQKITRNINTESSSKKQVQLETPLLQPARQVDLSLFERMATVANGAYCISHNLVETLFNDVAVDAVIDMQHQVIIVAFKGKTLTKKEWLKRQITLTSFQFGRWPYVKAQVDQEWYKDVQLMMPFIFKRINSLVFIMRDNIWVGEKEELKFVNVFFTGHGIGGAYAVLAAIKFEDEITRKESKLPPEIGDVRAFSFGQPRIGSPDFARQLRMNYDGLIYRLTHTNDFVPRIPNGKNSGFLHHLREFWIGYPTCDCELSDRLNTTPLIDGQYRLYDCEKYFDDTGTVGENMACNEGQEDTEQTNLIHRGPYFGIKMGECIPED
ncbi:hypothetical protein G9A89_002141 [Geosiphon pyriformis]|nr:hypothetical protein G9A89_002141 [Geosiphon pyriformis]